jgi:hypothetical protein
MAVEDPNESLTSIPAFEKYSVFTTTEKWLIVAMVSYAIWFSGLSSFIYYPAIHASSQSLSVPVGKINLTITSYLAVATVAPTLFGDLADVPTSCLSDYILSLYSSNLAIAV